MVTEDWLRGKYNAMVIEDWLRGKHNSNRGLVEREAQW